MKHMFLILIILTLALLCPVGAAESAVAVLPRESASGSLLPANGFIPHKIPAKSLSVPDFNLITKHPTSERVQAGGFAQFIARADNCINIIWHLQSPSGNDILAQNAPITFPGLEVSGLGSERLTLKQIPIEMDEWRVRAEFVYLSGNVLSDAAMIYVTGPQLTTPTIQIQPESASLGSGQTTTLKVEAICPSAGLNLVYQWYRNDTDSTSRGKAIQGATSPTYTPEQLPGTVYYYCAVRSSNETDRSAAALSNCAAVTYPEAPEGEPSTGPEIATQPVPVATLTTWGTEPRMQTEPATQPSTGQTPQPIQEAPDYRLTVIATVIAVAALALVIAIMVLLASLSSRKRRKSVPKKVISTRRPAAAQDWDDLSDLDLSYYLEDEEDQ